MHEKNILRVQTRAQGDGKNHESLRRSGTSLDFSPCKSQLLQGERQRW